MASHLRNGRLIARKAINQISIGSQTQTTDRRKIHVSTYDKNLDDQVRPTIVPDDVIQLQAEKYWGPHPKTGIFGPTSLHGNGGSGGGSHFSLHGNGGSGGDGGGGGSVLDQTTWFRAIEGVDKPSYS